MRDLVSEYEHSHQHPANRACHTIGIPLIVVSILLLLASLFVRAVFVPAAVVFAVGWAFQFAGHAIEGTRPEFLRDWRFLFVGVRWWLKKVRG